MEQTTENSLEPVNYRHGEVLLIGVKRFSDESTTALLKQYFTAKSRKKVDGIIASGKSGNAHRIVGGEVWKGKTFYNSNELLVFSDGTAKIVHPEHKDITLDKGAYRVRLQREQKGEEIRNVED